MAPFNSYFNDHEILFCSKENRENRETPVTTASNVSSGPMSMGPMAVGSAGSDKRKRKRSMSTDHPLPPPPQPNREQAPAPNTPTKPQVRSLLVSLFIGNVQTYSVRQHIPLISRIRRNLSIHIARFSASESPRAYTNTPKNPHFSLVAGYSPEGMRP